MTSPPRAVVTDIEGTTSRISFVHDVLFPYARARLPDFLAAHGGEPEVRQILAEVEQLAPGKAPLDALLGWMNDDAKITPLKTLQGLIWGEGYASGALRCGAGATALACVRRAALCVLVRIGSGAAPAVRPYAARGSDRLVQRIFRYARWRQA
jgi:enolase-phosphatase E1